MFDLADTLTVTSTNAPTGTKTRHDLIVLESAPVPGSEEFVVVGLDTIDNRLYVVTVDAEENLRSIAWGESMEEAVALFKEHKEG